MAEDTKKEILEDEDDSFEERVCSNVANLSGALSNLEDIDKGLMNATDQKIYRRMKKNIFQALYYYCECLPKITDEEE